MPKFKVGDKVKAIPAIAEISAPKMKGRVWTVTAVVAGGRRVDLESNGEKLSGILETALTAANAAACNARFKVGDRVKEVNHPFGKTHTITEVFTDGDVRVDEGKQKYPAAKYARITSSNAVVNAALAWKQGGEVAKNADDHARVRVVAETETLFGKKREEKTMTVGELRAAMARLGHGRLFADVVRDAEAGKDANPLLKLPCEAWITLA